MPVSSGPTRGDTWLARGSSEEAGCGGFSLGIDVVVCGSSAIPLRLLPASSRGISGIVDGVLYCSSGTVPAVAGKKPSLSSPLMESGVVLFLCLEALNELAREVLLLWIWCGVSPLPSICPSSVQPERQKLPCRISEKVGTLDATSPVACHMP